MVKASVETLNISYQKKQKQIFYYYWDFGQQDREKHDEYYDHLNFNLPGFAICRSTWDLY